MTAKTTPIRKGRTSGPKCHECGGSAAAPAHRLTDRHQDAIRARAAKLEALQGSVETRKVYRAPSRALEDAYYAELDASERAERIDYLIDSTLPVEPVITYDAAMARITLKEAGRRLGVTPHAVQMAILRGRMVGHKLGRDWLVEESEVRYYELTSLGRVGWPKGRSRKKNAA